MSDDAGDAVASVPDVPHLGVPWRIDELALSWPEVATAFDGEGPTLTRCQLVDSTVTYPSGGPALRQPGHARLTFVLFDRPGPAPRRPGTVAALEVMVSELRVTRLEDVVFDEIGTIETYADVDHATGRGTARCTLVYRSPTSTVLLQGDRLDVRLVRRLPPLSARRPPRTPQGHRDITLVLREAAARRTPETLGGGFAIVRSLLRAFGRFSWERDDDGWHQVFQDDVLTAWVHATAPLVLLFPPADRTYAEALAEVPVVDCLAPDAVDLVADREALDELTDGAGPTGTSATEAGFSPDALTVMLFGDRGDRAPSPRVRVHGSQY